MLDNNPEIWDEDNAEYIDSSDYSFDEIFEEEPEISADDFEYSDYEEYDEEAEAEYADDYGYEYDEAEAEPEQKEKSILRTVVYMVVVLIIAAVAAVGMWLAADDVLALTKPNTVVTITINEGDTLYDVAQNLQDHGLVRYKWLFMLYGKVSHAEEKMAPGTFELNQMYDFHALVNGLVPNSESRKTVTLTFPEGFSMDQIFLMLEENEVCTEAELKNVSANFEFEYEFLQDIPYGNYNRLEGFMFPDTYDFYVGDDPERVIRKFLNNFEGRIYDTIANTLDDINYNIRTAMEAEGSFTAEEIDNAMMDVYKVITVASLIEKEAGSDGERTLISSVIFNRLTTHVHELLQIDATVEYALGEHKEILSANDLGVDSPYNTYRYKGLPPGPIANPGILSIMAAMHPEDTEYFFYALNEYGTHEFFYTYIEQQEFLNAMDESANADAVEQPAQQPAAVEGEPAADAGELAPPEIPAPEADADGEEGEINAQ